MRNPGHSALSLVEFSRKPGLLAIHGCILHPRFDHQTFFPPGLSTVTLCHQFLWTLGGVGRTVWPLVFPSMKHRKWWTNCMTSRGPGKAKFCFELLKKCTKRGFKPESHGTPNVHANHLAMDDWLGRANARLRRCCYLFGRPTACTPAILIVSAGKGSNSHA